MTNAPTHHASRFRKAFSWLYPLMAGNRRWVALGVYSAISAGALALAYFLRFEAAIPPEQVRTLIWGMVLLVPIRMFCHLAFGVTTGRWRYASLRDLSRLMVSSLVGSAAFTLISWGVFQFDPRVPFGVVLIEWVLTTYAIAGVWAAYRMTFEWMQQTRRSEGVRRVLIIGAGQAGDRLLRELQRSGRSAFEAVGFVDNDRLKVNSSLHGVDVLGGLDDLGWIVRDFEVDEILVAMPSAGPRTMRKIVSACQDTGLQYRVLPAISAVLQGTVTLDQLRKVRVEDLLGREPIELALPELAADLGGQVVMVTGAAGSIGSELCRQIALHGPRTLVMFDQAESPLYFIDRELTEEYPDVDVVPVIGDVRDPEDVLRAFSRLGPTHVFHAAAYKHVPLMEANVRKAVENNVLGTRNVIEAAARWDAEKFVLISTDKAVRPSSIVGASKRAAELLLLRAGQEHPDMGWYAVRFGNVLGSAGSVIPLFKKQLGTGKPITLTHEDVTRYFMTIPEAVQLVLQASLLEEGRGRITMLDMGEPVRIMDLARDLIRLAGRIEGVDAEIQITGLRPGEKLHEELQAPQERAVPTGVKKISVLMDDGVGFPDPVAALCPDGGGHMAGCTDAELRERLMRLARDSHAHMAEAADTSGTA